MKTIGIISAGAYIPYYYLKRETIATAWGKRGGKGMRSMMNDDEDAVTMAVEASRQSLAGIKKEHITGLIFASTSAPYAEKSHAGIISAACDLPRKLYTADHMGSLKGATSAIKVAAAAATADEREETLVVAADCRNARPNSPKEQLLGDAAAAVVIGTENVAATIDEFVTTSDEIVDVWRNAEEKFVHWGEGRFIGDEGYMESLCFCIQEILAKSELKPSDFAKVIIPTSDMKEYLKVAKRMGFTPEQIQNPMMLEVGNCGSAQSLLLTVAALEQAQPGDRILVTNYANGADAMIITATDNIFALHKDSIEKLLKNRREFTSYSRFLSYRGLCATEPSVYNLKPSNSQTWREQATFIRFKGSRCKCCGLESFPINKVCRNCGSALDYELISLSDRTAKVFTFTLDELAGANDDPVVGQICADDEHGVRYYNNLTDFDPADIAVGTELEFTFRKMNELGNFKNYYWKFKPIRTMEAEQV